jgi:Mor family transcriptional regulator
MTIDLVEFALKIKPEQLPEPCMSIAKEIGIEATVKLVNLIGGEVLYIPKLKYLTIPIRKEMIIKEFDGYNYKTLAKKYDVSERWVREIVKKNKEHK